MFFKNIFDYTISFIGLLILWPLLLFVSLLIRIKMPNGPVIFTQQRVGKNGKLFKIHKFRTMSVIHGGSTISVAGETRITPLGAKLRKYKLDELLGLWDVLRGKMSFVGPRPDVPGYVDCLNGKYKEILCLKPGITGPASLKYRNEEEILALKKNPIKYNNEVIFPDKVKINFYYLHNWSFFRDMKIIIYTIFSKDLEKYY